MSSSAWATRSPFSPPKSKSLPPACSTSSATSTPAAAGPMASRPAPTGCPGASAWTGAPPTSACARGELSYSKVRALTRVATPETEERLLKFAKCGTAVHVERLVRGWRRVDRNAENLEAAQRHKSRSLYVYQDEDGMFVIRGRLTPEVGAVIRQALAAACDRMHANAPVNPADGLAPSAGQRQADALGMIAEAALHGDLDPGAPGERYQVVVHVDAPVLADPDQPGQSVLEDGDHVSAETSWGAPLE